MVAPASIARHLVVRQAINFPPPLDIPLEDIEQDEDAEQMQSKHEQPDDLTGFFAPAGFETRAPTSETASPVKKKKSKKDKSDKHTQAVDAEEGSNSPCKQNKEDSPVKKEKKEKKKKRKSEDNGTQE